MGVKDHPGPTRRLDTRGPGRQARRVTGPDWTRLAAYVVTARNAAGYKTTRQFAAATGIGEKTHYRLEQGKPVGRDTLAVVEQHVGWAPGSASAVLRGEEPRLLAGGLDAKHAAAQAEVIAMTPDELAQMHARIAAVPGSSREFADEWLQSAIELRKANAVQGPSSPKQTGREVG